MDYYYNESIQIENFIDIIDQYSFDEFYSPYRSTVYLLSFVQSPQFVYFLDREKIDGKTAQLYFEYPVTQNAGRGNASFTDLMIIDNSRSTAIEAKNTEPKYETVKKWLGTSVNRKNVLAGWLGLINTKLSLTITLNAISEIPYQMIHRLASACSVVDKEPAMFYFYFGIDQKMWEYYIKNLELLKDLTRNKLKIGFYNIECQKTDKLLTLEKEWGDGERDLSEDVTSGIRNNHLFDFVKASIHDVLIP